MTFEDAIRIITSKASRENRPFKHFYNNSVFLKTRPMFSLEQNGRTVLFFNRKGTCIEFMKSGTLSFRNTETLGK